MRAFYVIATLVAFSACGSTTSLQDTSGLSPQEMRAAACRTLEDSGVNCAACIGQNCCEQLNACARSPDGPQYEDCVFICITTAQDAGAAVGCQDSCGSSHANGAASCQPYNDCALQQCANSGC